MKKKTSIQYIHIQRIQYVFLRGLERRPSRIRPKYPEKHEIPFRRRRKFRRNVWQKYSETKLKTSRNHDGAGADFIKAWRGLGGKLFRATVAAHIVEVPTELCRLSERTKFYFSSDKEGGPQSWGSNRNGGDFFPASRGESALFLRLRGE